MHLDYDILKRPIRGVTVIWSDQSTSGITTDYSSDDHSDQGPVHIFLGTMDIGGSPLILWRLIAMVFMSILVISLFCLVLCANAFNRLKWSQIPTVQEMFANWARSHCNLMTNWSLFLHFLLKAWEWTPRQNTKVHKSYPSSCRYCAYMERHIWRNGRKYFLHVFQI